MADPSSSTNSVSALRGLWPFIRPYRVRAALALSLMVATAAISLVIPAAARQGIDTFAADFNHPIAPYFFGAIGLVLLLAVTSALRYYLVTSLGERVIADLRSALFKATLPKSPGFFEKTATGEVLSRITTDTTLILTVIGSSFSVAIRNVLMCVGGVFLMVWTAPKLSALVLLLVPAVLLPIILLGRRLRRLSRDNQDWIAESSGAAGEMLGAASNLQAFTYEPHAAAQFDQTVEAGFASAQRRVKTRALMTAVVIFVVFSGIVGVLWIAAGDLRAGRLSMGTMVQFVIYAFMVSSATGILSEVWGEIQRASGASERLMELLDAPDPIQNPTAPTPYPQPARGAVHFDNLRFAYPSRPDTPAIDGLSLDVTPGQRVALVGPSGSGKSTLMQLLLRFYDPQEGRILLDGTDLRDMALEEFRAQIALVPQDPAIFSQSALENIRIGAPNAPESDVIAAAKVAAAHEFICALPDGYATRLGPKGTALSGGQKQRIAIARAILRDAPLLLLDEATSALDAQSEHDVTAALDALSTGRTTLIIAHRLSTIQNADWIVVMDQGKIVAQGTHTQLLQENGLYARLAELQYATAPRGSD